MLLLVSLGLKDLDFQFQGKETKPKADWNIKPDLGANGMMRCR